MRVPVCLKSWSQTPDSTHSSHKFCGAAVAEAAPVAHRIAIPIHKPEAVSLRCYTNADNALGIEVSSDVTQGKTGLFPNFVHILFEHVLARQMAVLKILFVYLPCTEDPSRLP